MRQAALARASQNAPDAISGANVLQRKCACDKAAGGLSDECEACGREKNLGLQAKLAIGAAEDPYEREADQVAASVMSCSVDTAPTTRSQHALGRPIIQRRIFNSRGADQNTLPAIVEDTLSSPGQPIDVATRSVFEPRFDHDFARVRLHTDARADRSAVAVNALAYTSGTHIVFVRGQYDPGSASGQRLLAHELTHVVQQTGGGSERGQSAMRDQPRSPTTGRTIQRFAVRDYVPGFLADAAAASARQALSALGTLDPSSITGVAERALRIPGVAPLLLSHPALVAHRKSIELLQATPGAIEAVRDLIENPEPYTSHIKESLAPYVTEAQQLATRHGGEVLAQLGLPAQYQAPVGEVLAYVASLAHSAFTFVIDEIILDTVLFWQLRSERQIYKEAWKKYEDGAIDAVDLIAEHLAIVLNVIGRVEDLMPLVLAAAGVASGGVAGGTAGSAVQGAGTAAGAGGGGGAGGAGGLAVSEVLGLVAVLGPGALEIAKGAKASVELVVRKQDEKQRQQDFGQIATSAFSLLIMAALAFLPGLTLRLGKKMGRKLLDMIPDPAAIQARIAARLPTGARAGADNPPAGVTVTSRPVAGAESGARAERIDAGARIVDAEAPVAISSHKSNKDIFPEELSREIDYVDRHPERVEGVTLERKARIGDGEHAIEETPHGCQRHSDEDPIPLTRYPLVMGGKAGAAPQTPSLPSKTKEISQSDAEVDALLGGDDARDLLEHPGGTALVSWKVRPQALAQATPAPTTTPGAVHTPVAAQTPAPVATPTPIATVPSTTAAPPTTATTPAAQAPARVNTPAYQARLQRQQESAAREAAIHQRIAAVGREQVEIRHDIAELAPISRAARTGQPYVIPQRFINDEIHTIDEVNDHLDDLVGAFRLNSTGELPLLYRRLEAEVRVGQGMTPALAEALRNRFQAISARVLLASRRTDQVFNSSSTDLTVDHIVSQDEIMGMGGFMRLPFEQQLEVLHMEINLIVTSRQANSSKHNRSWWDWDGSGFVQAAKMGPRAGANGNVSVPAWPNAKTPCGS